MKFRNVRNGMILDLPDTFRGTYWEPVDKQPAPAASRKEAKKAEPVKKTTRKKV